MSLLKSNRLRSGEVLLSHGSHKTQLLKDYVDDQSITYLDALVTSGKCLFTLATELDEATRLLATKPDIARSRIERITRTLQQLQNDYRLVQKLTSPH